MTDSTFKNLNAYLPYLGEDFDPLFVGRYIEVRLLCFPESTDLTHSEDLVSSIPKSAGLLQSRNPRHSKQFVLPSLTKSVHESDAGFEERKRDCEFNQEVRRLRQRFLISYTVDEIDDIILSKYDSTTERLKTWMRKLSDKYIKVDVGRVTRFAIYRNRSDLVL